MIWRLEGHFLNPHQQLFPLTSDSEILSHFECKHRSLMDTRQPRGAIVNTLNSWSLMHHLLIQITLLIIRQFGSQQFATIPVSDSVKHWNCLFWSRWLPDTQMCHSVFSDVPPGRRPAVAHAWVKVFGSRYNNAVHTRLTCVVFAVSVIILTMADK